MKHFFLVLGLLIASHSYAQTNVRVPLSAVTLYLNGAELHHEGTVNLPAGPANVRLVGLSPYLNGVSIQAEAIGAELDEVQLLYGVPGSGPAADSLHTAEATWQRLTTEETTIVAETEFLQQNKALERITAGKWVEETRTAAAYYSKRRGELAEREAVVKTQLAAQTLLLKKLRQQLGVQSTDSAVQAVVLHLTLPRAATVKLRVGYQLRAGNASNWNPEYDLRVSDSDMKHLTVVSRAHLINDTGLPWTTLPVSLRTVAPAASINRPNLAEPWSVSFSSNDNDDGEGRLDNFAVKGKGNNGTAAGNTTAPDLGARLDLTEPVSVPLNDTRTYKLAEQSLPMQLEYLAVPKRDDQAFLIGRITQWNQVNFLSETAKVFFRGVYVGETAIDTRAYDDTLDVSLGRDPQVQLTRTKREDFEGSGITLSGNRKKTKLAYELNVKNNHPYPVRLRLLDQVPISQDKDITVKVQDISEAVLEEASGKLTWMFTLPAGGSRRFRTAFTVDAPRSRRTSLFHRRRRIYNPKFR